jgi:pyruvate dehydrogenase E1 component beta subunit
MTTEGAVLVLPPVAVDGAVMLRRWLVAPGDSLRAGDIVAEVAAGALVIEIEAEISGTLEFLLVPEGTAGLFPGSPLARLRADGTDAEKTRAEAEIRADARGKPPMGQTVRTALRDALAAEMARDPTVFIMGESVGETDGPHRVTHGLLDRFGPRRVIDTPIPERGFTGLCVGAAMAGLRPVVELSDFAVALSALEHIVSTAARLRSMSGGRLSCPVVVRGPHGFAPRAGAQLGQSIGSALAHFPGLKIVQPYCAQDAAALLSAAIRDPDPVLFLETEALYSRGFVPESEAPEAIIGKARIRRSGHDVTIVAIGPTVEQALSAAETLGREGISAEVIDLRSLRPLDGETVLASVARTGRCMTVEEAWPIGGIGDRIAGLLVREALDTLRAPLACLSVADRPLAYAEALDRAMRPGTDLVENTARRLVQTGGAEKVTGAERRSR